VPADKTRWSAFDQLAERNFHLVRTLLEDASRTRRSGARDPERKVGDFFAATLDTSRRERRGMRPLRIDLDRISALRYARDLPGAWARLHRAGIPSPFRTGVAPDEKASSKYALYIFQGGLALPDRDYYLSPRFGRIRRAYLRHVAKTFELTGGTKSLASDRAGRVLAVEARLAQASRTRVELRDAVKNYNRFTLPELSKRYPGLQWDRYFTARGAKGPKYVVVGQPEFFDVLERSLGSIPLSDWKTYLHWHLVHDAAAQLGADLEEEDFDFFHRRLLGQREPEPAWKRAAQLVDRSLGEALGRLYVERYFPNEALARVTSLVDDVQAVFRGRLAQIPWMTDSTRTAAIEKFRRFTSKIGRPRRFRTYAKVRVDRSDHFGNFRRSRTCEIDRDVARIGHAVDRNEWQMTPPTVNAQFDPTRNEILFPAGILQPPFFDAGVDDPVNLGGIAVVIGHEITHGYDDQGRRYDAEGNLNDWWSPADAREFQSRAQRIVEQYGRFEPLPGVRLNGELTMGENIADLGGVSLAFEALERRLADGRSPRGTIDGFTPEQRFFLSYGQIWRSTIREEELKRRLVIDPHSPGRFRVNGVLANLPEFWKAFEVPEGAPMRQAEDRRVEIW
jgi:putative endopeptidase